MENKMTEGIRVEPLGRHGRGVPTYQAKIGTGPGCVVVVKRIRVFKVDMKVEFAQVLPESRKGPWESGHIWKIEDDRLYISRQDVGV